MNKKLLAIAVGAVIALPGAALANPTVYGKVNVTLDSMETEFRADTFPGTAFPADAVDQWQLNSNASRLGVKGEYDLEVGGLKALYQAEYEINVDDGGGAPFSQRNIFAGLKGGFGTLKAGKFDTVIKTAEGKVDQFNDLPGDMDSFVAGQDRANNIIQYTSPKLADSVTINVATILAEGADVDLDANTDAEEGLFDIPQVSVVFQQGGLYAALAYAQNSATATRTADGITRADIMRLVAQYKMDALEIGGLFQQTSDVASGSDLEDTSMMISAAFSIDRIKLKAQYGMTSGDQSDEELTMMGLGADYKLAKASKAFVYMTKLEKDSTGEENSVFGLGLEHNF